MPMGNEVHYCVTGPVAVARLAQALGITLIDYDDDEIDLTQVTEDTEFEVSEFKDDAALTAVDEAIERAYKKALTAIGCTYTRPGEYPYNDAEIWNTPFGERIIRSPGLEFAYDSEEAGDAIEHMSLGVAFSGRYKGVFLDLENDGCLWNLDLTKAIRDSQIFIDYLVAEVPELSHLRLILRDIFY